MERQRKARAAERQQARERPAAKLGKVSPILRTLVDITASASEGSSVAWPMDVESVRPKA